MLIRLFEEINDMAVQNNANTIPIPSNDKDLIIALSKFLDLASLQVKMN
jgi:hypothetical protein